MRIRGNDGNCGERRGTSTSSKPSFLETILTLDTFAKMWRYSRIIPHNPSRITHYRFYVLSCTSFKIFRGAPRHAKIDGDGAQWILLTTALAEMLRTAKPDILSNVEIISPNSTSLNREPKWNNLGEKGQWNAVIRNDPPGYSLGLFSLVLFNFTDIAREA